MSTIICFLIGHRFVGTGTVMFGLFPATPVCKRCGKYATSKKKETEDGKQEL